MQRRHAAATAIGVVVLLALWSGLPVLVSVATPAAPPNPTSQHERGIGPTTLRGPRVSSAARDATSTTAAQLRPQGDVLAHGGAAGVVVAQRHLPGPSGDTATAARGPPTLDTGADPPAAAAPLPAPEPAPATARRLRHPPFPFHYDVDAASSGTSGTVLLPNLFTTPASTRPSLASYHSAAAVFLHVHKSAGMSSRAIVDAVCKAEGAACMLGVTAVSRRARVTTGVGASRHVHGGYTFGMCEHVAPVVSSGGVPATDRSCGYFTLLREPIARTMSDYRYCVTRGQNYEDYKASGKWQRTLDSIKGRGAGDYLCTSTSLRHFDRPTPPTLVEWARARGNHALNLIMLSQESLAGADKAGKPYEWTPIEWSLSMDRLPGREHLAHAIASLERWFVGVGLTERFEESMLLWKHAVNAPDSVKVTGVHSNKGVSKTLRGGGGAVGGAAPGARTYGLSEADFEAVSEAVALDMELYRAAEALFERELLGSKAQFPELAARLEQIGR